MLFFLAARQSRLLVAKRALDPDASFQGRVVGCSFSCARVLQQLKKKAALGARAACDARDPSAGAPSELGDRHAGLELGGRELGVAEQRLEAAHVGPVLEHQAARGVAREFTPLDRWFDTRRADAHIYSPYQAARLTTRPFFTLTSSEASMS